MIIFWFKRDLRLSDNTALKAAIESGSKILLLYIYEPKLWGDAHYSERHENFVVESLYDLQSKLKEYSTKVLLVREEATVFFEKLFKKHNVDALYSHQETGLDLTFSRDKAISRICRQFDIKWYEFQSNGVLRGIRNRKNWSRKWYAYMSKQEVVPDFQKAHLTCIKEVDQLLPEIDRYILKVADHKFQRGGESVALEVMDDFLKNRLEFYSAYISKPEESRVG